MKQRVWLTAALAVIGLLAATVQAADNDKTATGTWTSTFSRGDRSFKSTYKLKQDGHKLTGTVTSGRNIEPTKIANGKVEDGKVSFDVTRESPNGGTFTIHYHGTLKGDTIEGKAEGTFNDQKREFPWKATRAKSEK